MTTSILQTFTRDGIGDQDLYVIRDFALEAPWEWRLALEQLVEIAFKSDRLETEIEKARTDAQEIRKEFDELQTAVKLATQKMLRLVEKLEVGRREGNLTKGDIDNITEGIRAAFEQLVDTTD